MVSNLDAESKDPNLYFGGFFPKSSLFGDVDYSWQYWLRGKTLSHKNQWREQLSKVIFGNKTHEQKQLTQQWHFSDHSRFYDQNISTVNFETEDPNSNHGKIFLTFFFHRLCRLKLTVLAKKETTQQNKSRKRAVNRIVSHDHKTQQQKQLPQHRHLLDNSRLYCVMVSNLDAESKDSSLDFVEFSLKTFRSVM